MSEYPSGTVAFLFTDIEGSTRRWETQQQAMWSAVERHFALLRSAVASHDGVVFKTIGDAVQAAFPSVPGAVAAAVAAQAALQREDWGELGPLRVRMAIHAGEANPRNGDYLAPALNRLARVLATGYGDQVLLTETASALLAGNLPAGHALLDLGAHRLRDLLVAERIYQLTGPGLVAEFPPLKSLDRQPHNLPAQPTPLIGREDELADLRAAIAAPGVRLITLTGPGGTGKTRLALQVAAESLDAFPDGVWWAPLAAVTDPALIPEAIAAPLGVREVAGEPLLTTLGEHLRARRTLLLLDNLEQVVTAAPLIAQLLHDAPHLTVLATSREPLRVRAEREFPIAPLPVPTSLRQITVETALISAAVRLFVERAQAVRPAFVLDDANVSDVVAICQRLDGLPLAIELAAARVRILSPAALSARLDRRLSILTGGARDLPARQQTLRAAIAWSHDLLDDPEQALFAQLAVFSGGCTFEAAQAVASTAGDISIDLFEGLESLVQKSLLRQEEPPAGDQRFTMLETIREYALERLEEGDRTDPVRLAHAEYFLSFAEEAEPKLTSPEQAAWLNRLDADHDNFRAALAWLDLPDQAELRLRLVRALWRFWWVRGHLSEGRAWLDRSLATAINSPPEVRANALSGAGILAESQGDYDRAIALHDEALALWRKIDDQIGIGASLTNLGIIARVHGDYGRATSLHSQALVIFQELGDNPGMAGSLYELGLLALNQGNYLDAESMLGQSLELSRGLGEAAALGGVLESLGILAFYQEDYERAADFYQESLAVWRELDDSRMIALALSNLGEAVHHQDDLVRAKAFYVEALAIFRDLGEKRGAAFALGQLGKLALAENEITGAESLFTESLALRQQVGEKAAIIESLEGLAATACRRGSLRQGVRLFGASAALRHALGIPLPESYLAERDRSLAMAKTTLDDATFAHAWAHGQTLTLEQASVEALTASHPPVLKPVDPENVQSVR